MFKIIPLGGLGEIGMNMMIVEYQDSFFIIDAGLMFPEDYMLGVDYVIPNMDYIRQNSSKILGIVLTHAHEDHIGAIPYLLKEVNAPVFGTSFTLGVVRHKLQEHNLLSSTVFHEIFPREKLQIGPFELMFIRVGHSIIDGIGIAIKTPYGLIVHTGDFRINHTSIGDMITDVNGFARYGEEGVLALFSDSTNVEKEGYTISSKQIGETISRIVSGSKGRIIVSLFASNINRIQQIVDIAINRERKVAFDGRSIQTSVNIAKDLGYISIPEEMEIGVSQVNDYSDDEIVMITTGSQGEPMSSLVRMAAGTHKQIKIKKNDTVILSSKFIPGNERAIGNIINKLFKQGAEVIYEKISEIHVSGHAFQEELKLMIHLTKPKHFIPIHGEYRHLVLHAHLAEALGISKERILLAENGQVLEFDENGGRIKDRVKTGRLLVDGKGIGDVGKSILKERRLLSKDGLVVVNMALDVETGVVVYGPEIVSRGFVFETQSGHLLEDAKSAVLKIVEDIKPDVPDRIDKIRSKIRTTLKKYFDFSIRRHPVILPFILEV